MIQDENFQAGHAEAGVRNRKKKEQKEKRCA